MPTIVREDKDTLNMSLHLTISSDDYLKKFNSELNKYQKTAQIKGFRKGKTPTSVLKKMYGDNVLSEVINKVMQEELYGFLERESLNILGQPILSEDQQMLSLSHKDLKDYHFTFDIGLAPKFELMGATKDDVYIKYRVDAVPEAVLDEEIALDRKRQGAQIEVEDEIKEQDLVKLVAKELENGVIKEGGIENSFSIPVDDNLTPEAKAAFLGKKKEDTLVLNIFEIEHALDEKKVRQYYLGLDKEDERTFNPEFELTITGVTRMELAALTPEFFMAVFGEERNITTEEEARAAIAEDIIANCEVKAQHLLSESLRKQLMEKNPIELPDDFLKRWMFVSSEEERTAEDIAQEYEKSKEGLKWTILRGKVEKEYDIKVEKEEIVSFARSTILRMYGAYISNVEMLNNIVGRMLNNKDEVLGIQESILNVKVLEQIKELVTIEERLISYEELENLMKKEESFN
jgi:trigger factor